MTANQPYLLEISRRYDLIRLWMNRKRGEKLGIKDGDLVQIKSLVGEGKDPGEAHRRSPPLFRLASQRVRSIFQAPPDRL